MSKSVVCVVLVGCFVVGGSAVAFAHDDAGVLGRIVKSGEFRVGMSGSQPPFCVKSKSGQLIGYEVELAASLANAMGVELKIVEKPFGELLGALEGTGLLELLEKKWFEDGSWLLQVP